MDWWIDTEKGKPQREKKTPVPVQVRPPQIFKQTGLGSNCGLRGGSLAVNRLNQVHLLHISSSHLTVNTMPFRQKHQPVNVAQGNNQGLFGYHTTHVRTKCGQNVGGTYSYHCIFKL